MNPFFNESHLLLLLLALWAIPWKIYAVWTAAKLGHKWWFVFLVILNTFSILELIYIFYVAKKKWPEVKSAFKRAVSSKSK
jgi:hypothetical protein